MIDFFKYNSAGNDFIIVDNRKKVFPLFSDYIKKLCDRKFGIGADGFISLESHDTANYFMNYFNSDGVKSSFCGNGNMCCAHLAQNLNILSEENSGFFATREGVFKNWVNNHYVSINMPNVLDIQKFDNHSVINTGSPHYIVFTNKLDDIDVHKEGCLIRYSEPFKKEGVNVTFIQISKKAIYIRTYERGVEGETLSCGTGVVASAIAYYLKHVVETDRPCLKVHTRGGILDVSFNYNQHSGVFSEITLSNKVSMVFKGVFPNH